MSGAGKGTRGGRAPRRESGGAAEILMVEDNPADVELFTEALAGSGWKHRLHLVVDGAEALEFLHGAGRHAGAPRPDLVMLDLNIPRKSGREVLAELRADAGLAGIPVVVVSGSAWDPVALEPLGVTREHFVAKPDEFRGFCDAVAVLRAACRAPAKSRAASRRH